MNFGWYKPGVSQQEFAQDKFACMNGSQMQVSASNVNGTGSTYYDGGNVTCNTYGSTTNCSGGGGYSQPGYVSGSSASYTTTNQPLFQACMQARGYVWTNETAVNNYEGGQRSQTAEAARQRAAANARAASSANAAAASAAAASRAAAGISAERYAASQARCRAKAAPDEPLCEQLTAEDVTRSEAAAGIAKSH
jgi:hypothetical protein